MNARRLIRSPRWRANVDIPDRAPTCRRSRFGCELPVASDLLPHHEIFAGDFFRHRPLGLEAEGANLSRRGRPEWLDVEGCEFRIADLLRHAFPQCLDRGSALHHAGTGWKCGGVFGVERRDAGEITLVEEIYPLRVHRLNLG